MKARALVGRGEEGPYVPPDLSYYYYWQGAREQCEDNKWDEQNKNVAKVYDYRTQHPYPFPGKFYYYFFSRQKLFTEYLF